MRVRREPLVVLIGVLWLTGSSVLAQDTRPNAVLFQNVRIFDGKGSALSDPFHVLVRGNLIEAISREPLPSARLVDAQIIDGRGRTLIPGMIDAHTHLMFATLPQAKRLTGDAGFLNVAAVRAARDMLLRGFTSIRDLADQSLASRRASTQDWSPASGFGPPARSSPRAAVTGTFVFPTSSRPRRKGCRSVSEWGLRSSRTTQTRCDSASANNWPSGPPRSG